MDFQFIGDEAERVKQHQQSQEEYRQSVFNTWTQHRKFLGEHWVTIRDGIAESCKRFNTAMKREILIFSNADIDRADFYVSPKGKDVSCWLDRETACVKCSYNGYTETFRVMNSDVPVFVHDYNETITPEGIVEHVIKIGTKAAV